MSPVVKKNYNLLTFLKVMSEYRVASFYMYLTSAFWVKKISWQQVLGRKYMYKYKYTSIWGAKYKYKYLN